MIPRSDGGLHVRISAPPIGGKANKELVAFLSEQLRVPRSRIVVVRGRIGRHKVIEIEGLTVEEVLRRLAE